MNQETKREIVEKAFSEISKIHKYLDDPIIISPPKSNKKTILCGYAREEEIVGELKFSNNLGWRKEKEVAIDRIDNILTIMNKVPGYSGSHDQNLFNLVVSQTFERAMVIDAEKFVKGCAACIRDGSHDIMFRWLTNHSCISYPGFRERRAKEIEMVRKTLRKNSKTYREGVWFCP
jgi:hypothetical protein